MVKQRLAIVALLGAALLAGAAAPGPAVAKGTKAKKTSRPAPDGTYSSPASIGVTIVVAHGRIETVEWRRIPCGGGATIAIAADRLVPPKPVSLGHKFAFNQQVPTTALTGAPPLATGGSLELSGKFTMLLLGRFAEARAQLKLTYSLTDPAVGYCGDQVQFAAQGPRQPIATIRG